jgi:hypothetical protein
MPTLNDAFINLDESSGGAPGAAAFYYRNLLAGAS